MVFQIHNLKNVRFKKLFYSVNCLQKINFSTVLTIWCANIVFPLCSFKFSSVPEPDSTFDSQLINCTSFKLLFQWQHVGSLQSAIEGVLIQHKLANTMDQDLFLQRNIYQHSTGKYFIYINLFNYNNHWIKGD